MTERSLEGNLNVSLGFITVSTILGYLRPSLEAINLSPVKPLAKVQRIRHENLRSEMVLWPRWIAGFYLRKLKLLGKHGSRKI